MIPKIVHYCWFGPTSMSAVNQKYIIMWHNLYPDYSFMSWSESDFFCNHHLFTKKAQKLQNWAAISDYVRLNVLFSYGGVYTDTDVKPLRPVTPLLKNKSFIGLELPNVISSGLIYATQPRDKNVANLLKIYNYLATLSDFKNHLNDSAYILTAYFMHFGFKPENKKQIINGCTIYPTSYFCPRRLDKHLDLNLTRHAYSIHEYEGSWTKGKDNQRYNKFIKQLKPKINYYSKIINKIF